MHRPVCWTTLLLALMVTWASLAPCTASALPGMTTMTGQVLNVETEEPAVGVEVCVYAQSPDGSWNMQAWAVPVDKTGRFSINVYNDSRQHVMLFKGSPNYSDMALGGSPWAWDENWNKSWPMDLPDGEVFQTATKLTPSGGTLSLGTVRLQPRPAPFGAVTGRLSDEFGNPLPDPIVNAWRFDEGAGEWRHAAWTQPNMGGQYTFVGTAERPLTGQVKIEYEIRSGLTVGKQYYGGADLGSARAVTVAPGTTVHGINHQAILNNRAYGRAMVAETKKPLRYINVELQTDETDYTSAAGDQTLADGSFFLGREHSVPADTYVIALRDPVGRYYPGQALYYGQSLSRSGAKKVTIAEGQNRGGLDVWFSKVAAVAGTVVNPSDVPLPDILVQTYKVGGGGALTLVGSDHTDSLGMYRVLCPSAGTYTLKFIDEAGTTDAADDSVAWLGGADSAASAETIAVASDRAAVPAPFKMTPADASRASRVYGMNDYESAIQASRTSFASGAAPCVVIASGTAWADALSGSNLTGVAEGPMLLTRFDEIPPGVVAELDRLGATKLYLMGGPKTISVRQENTFRALGFEVERIGGIDRFEVNANSADEADDLLGEDDASVGVSLAGAAMSRPAFVTSGLVYPDALAVAPVVHSRKGVVLLTKPTGVAQPVLDAASRLGATSLIGVGGPLSLTSQAKAAFAQRGMSVTVAAAGSDRYHTAALFAKWAKDRGYVSAGRVGIANGGRFQEALIAGPALGSTGHALLLTRSDSLPSTTKSAASSLRDGNGIEAVVYGNTGQVSSKVLSSVGAR